MIEMIASVIDAIVGFVQHYRFSMGLVIGGLAAAIFTTLFSYPVWGSFNTGLFSILFIPCVLVSLYWQMKSEKR